MLLCLPSLWSFVLDRRNVHTSHGRIGLILVSLIGLLICSRIASRGVIRRTLVGHSRLNKKRSYYFCFTEYKALRKLGDIVAPDQEGIVGMAPFGQR